MIDTQTFFEALADTSRRRILALLLDAEELCVCDLHSALDISQPKVSRHLAVLREAKLVTTRRTGTWVRYRLHSDLPSWGYSILRHMKDGMGLDSISLVPSACDDLRGTHPDPR